MRRDPLAAPSSGAPFCAWSGLIEAMLDAVWLVDASTLRVVAANHAAGELMAVSPHDLVGRGVVELASTPEDLAFWDDVAQGLADRIESETFVTAAHGATRAVTRRVQRIAADPGAGAGAGAATLFVVVLHDRSERVRIERELESTAADLRATLEATQDGILVTDLAGRIGNFNRRFGALWRIPDDMLLRRDDDAVLDWMRRSVVDPSDYMRRLATIDGSATLKSSDRVALRWGQVLERVTAPQCRNGLPTGRLYTFRDPTGMA